MGNSSIPNRDTDLMRWMTNFVTVLTPIKSMFGLTAEDLTTLSEDQGAFNSALTAQEAAKEAFHAATENKDETRKTMVTDVRSVIKRIQASPSITPVIQKQLGINANDGKRTHTPPKQPINLITTGESDGINHLKWNRNGNRSGTIFVIEAMAGAATTFAYVASITATKFDHIGQTPGVKVTYRVTATRAGEKSVPSATAVVYDGVTMLQISKAA